MTRESPPPVRITFEGQFLTFKEAEDAYPLLVAGYLSPSHMDSIVLAKRKLSSLARGEMPDSAWGNCRENIVLSTLSAMPKKDDVLRVLDVGGGLGAFYISLKISCPQVKVDYAILELADTVEQGNLLFAEFSDVKFIAEMPSENERFDVIVFGSSLQYFEKYIDIIRTTCSYRPETIILTDCLMGVVDTFVCAQLNVPDRVLPMWVFNRAEIISLFSDHGYSLQLKSISHFPFHNFANYNNDVSKTRYTNLIFQRGMLHK